MDRKGGIAAPAPDPDPVPDPADLIVRVGERVRRAREAKGMPRRVLSERSGVSPRYLAQLETGAGNISIGLLQRVAAALDHRIEWFVGEADAWTSETMRIADLYHRADAQVQDQVLELLGSHQPQARRARRICLLGLRGAGKSTLGALAGKALDMPFVQLNHQIEDQSGIPVAEVMALYGPEGYRKLEAQALRHVVATQDRLILEVAGGVVSDPVIFGSLLNDFHTIWLRAAPEDHMARVRAQGDERPMTGNPEAMAQLRSILTSREAIYDRAQARLDTAGKSVEQSLDELLALIETQHFLA